MRLFDGEELVERTSVAVGGDTIVAVDPDVRVVDPATRVDGRDLSSLPGLIAAHTHRRPRAHGLGAPFFGAIDDVRLESTQVRRAQSALDRTLA
ncbi:hypothetical protein [Nannocystis pusilla]|uniref:Amidohydrolase n=1 Tax=Nannocystis pusilla TaxID=889268 RepID=A0ABS7TPF3_9BACT|nr:hypothetical protein [Nannocystis pusilla]MBZ5710051.1 hypothetical protein [Nannocystis pusilla]